MDKFLMFSLIQVKVHTEIKKSLLILKIYLDTLLLKILY